MASSKRSGGRKPGTPTNGKPIKGNKPASSGNDDQQQIASNTPKQNERTLTFQGPIWGKRGKEEIGDIDMEYLLENLRLKQDEVDQSASKSVERRNQAHMDRRRATVQYEQFLYYQNITHRYARILLLEYQRAESQSELKESEKTQRLWEHGGLWDYNNYLSDPYLIKLLEYYDTTGVGAYRDRIQRAAASGIQPDDLHLWTPPPRRRFVGLSNRLRGPEMPSFADFQLNLDEEAIEAKRAEVERQILTPAQEGMQLEYKTHSERRLNELPYDEWRPMTSNVRGADPKKFKDSFQHIRTETGLFIAAKESSYDWLTSYDCLGKLVNNRRTISTKKPKAGKASKKTSSQQNNQDTQEQPTGKGTTPKPKGKGTSSSSKAGGDYDYDYPDNEFIKPPSEERSRAVEKTSHIFEATTGRREWHVAQKVLESSPPTSPPIAPRPYKTDVTTIDDNEIILPSENLPLLQNPRCPHKKTCRAGWMHPPSECWEAVVEDFGDLTAPRHPASVDMRKLAHTSREIYANRLGDHYARMQSTENQSWPTLGVRVPYSPTTLYDDPDVMPEPTSETSSDEYHRRDAIRGVNPMAMPILGAFVNEPERTSGPTAPLPVPEQPPSTSEIPPVKPPTKPTVKPTGSGEASPDLPDDPPDEPPSPGVTESLNDLFRQTYLGNISAQQGQ